MTKLELKPRTTNMQPTPRASNMEPKPRPSNMNLHKNDSYKFEAWQDALNSLQSKVQEARIEMGRVISQKTLQPLTARVDKKKS